MPFVPVDNDPFAEQPQDTGTTQQPSDAGATSGSFVPVDHDPFAAAAPAIPTTAEGLKNLDKQLAAGAIEGASVALSPPSTANFLERGADWLWNKVMPAGPAGPRPEGVFAPGGLSAAAHEPIQRAIDAVTAPAGAPTTPVEEGARRVGSYVGGGVVGGVSPVRSVLGAGGDILAGDLFKGTPYETPARIIGGILGASAPTAAARVVAPKPLSPERLAAVNSLEQAGVPMTAGEYTGNNNLRYLESTLSDQPLAGGKAAAIKSQQGEALAKEVMGRAGSPGELMTRENMEKGFERLGKTYEDIGTRNDLKFDPTFAQDLNNVTSKYENSVHIANNKPIVYREVAKIYDAAMSGGGMSGIQYQNWRSQLGKGANTLYRNGDEGSAQAIKDLRGALDSAFVRSVKDPADAAKLMETNRQYSAMKGVQKGIERAGGDPILGLLGQNPAATLRSMATGTKGHRGFTDLADAANTVLKPLPNSGTAQRMGNILTLGTMVGDFVHGGIPIATAARMGIPPILARGLMSEPVQNLLKNQTFANVKVSPQRGLLPAFAANPGILSQLQYLGQ